MSEPDGSPTEDRSRPLRADTRQLAARALFLGLVVVGGFALFDLLVTGYRLHAAAELAACVVFALVAWRLRSGEIDSRSLLPGTFAVGGVIAVVVLTGAPEDGVLVWAALFPPIPFFLHGLRPGLLLSLGFSLLLTAGVALPLLLGWPRGFDWVAPFNLAGAAGAATALAFLYEQTRERTANALAAMASTDPLTGIANRRGFERGFDCRMALARRSHLPISLMVLDLDRLKHVNDEAGHRAGDTLIRHVVQVLSGRIREQDLLARIGGDELALLLPATDLNGALRLARVLLQLVRQTPLNYEGRLLRPTLSIGVAQAIEGGEGFDQLFAAADAGLYRAKRGGRDRVVPAERGVSG